MCLWFVKLRGWSSANWHPIVLLVLTSAIVYSEAQFETGELYSHATTAPPGVQRPPTASCSVGLMTNQLFDGLHAEFRSRFKPPSDCRPRWTKVVLDWNGRVESAQIDRLASLWIGGAEVFRGSTPFATQFGAIWHVDKDLTQYTVLFEEPQNITALLPNPQGFSNPGTIFIDATVTFYATDQAYDETAHPNLIVPLSGSKGGAWFNLSDNVKNATITVSLPRNIVSAQMEVYATGHNCEEYWYASMVAGCQGMTPFREIRILVDGQLAGVAWPFPIIYAGGCDAGLWRPIPSIRALDIPSNVVSLSPFAARFSDGNEHSISLQVFENSDFWRVDGNLLLWLDSQRATITGSLTEYDILQDPAISWNQMLLASEIQRRIHVARSMVLSGYTNGSKGRVETTVRESMTFDNTQGLNLLTLVGSVNQLSSMTTVTKVESPGLNTTETLRESYTINADCQFQLPQLLPDAFDLTLERTSKIQVNGSTNASSSVSDAVHAESRRSVFNIFANDETKESYIENSSSTTTSGRSQFGSFSVSQVRPDVPILGVGLIIFMLSLFAPSLRGFEVDKQRLGASVLLGLGLSVVLLGGFFGLLKYAAVLGFKLGYWALGLAVSPEVTLGALGTVLSRVAWRRLERLEAAQTRQRGPDPPESNGGFSEDAIAD